MGSSPNSQVAQLPIVETRFGVAKIAVTQVTRHLVGRGQTYECYLTLTVNNQNHRSKNFDERGYQHLDDTFDFIINSRHQINGRALVVELWQKGTLSEKSLAIGMVDFNNFTESKGELKAKVYLNDKEEKLGWVQLKCSFEQMKPSPITMMFDSVMLRRKSSNVMKCKIKVIIGEQELCTSLCQDREDKIASWKEDFLTFQLLKNITNDGKIFVMQEDKELGSLSLDLMSILQSQEEQIQIREEFHYISNVVAGTLRFFIKKGETRLFQVSQVIKSAFVGDKKGKLPMMQVAGLGQTISSKQGSKLEPIPLLEKSKLQELEKQKQAQISRLKAEFQEKSKLYQAEKAQKLTANEQQIEKLKAENAKIKEQYEQEASKIKEQLKTQRQLHTAEKGKREQQFQKKLQELQSQNQKLRKEEQGLSKKIGQLEAEISKSARQPPEVLNKEAIQEVKGTED